MDLLIIIPLIFSATALMISLYFSIRSAIFSRMNKFADHTTEIDKLAVSHPILLSVYNDDEMNALKGDKESLYRIQAFAYLHFNVFENVFLTFLSRRSFFSIGQKRAWDNYIRTFFETSFIKDFWASKKRFYDDNFITYIDNILKETNALV